MSVADILLPQYFRLANTAAVLIEGPLQLYITQHTTAQHKATIQTACSTTARLAGGKRSHDACQPSRLCGHRDLCSDTIVARSTCPLYPVRTCCFKIIELFSITCTYSSTVRTAMHHLRPHARKPTNTSTIEYEPASRARPAVLL